MAIVKSDFPILERVEFDFLENEKEFYESENLEQILPKKLAFVFLGDYVDEFARIFSATKITAFQTFSKSYSIYTMNYNGDEIAFCQAPSGASASCQVLEWLIVRGVKSVVAVSTVKILNPNLDGAYMLGIRALRDEGTSYHYLQPSRFIELDEKVLWAIKQAFLIHGIEYQEVCTWTSDSMSRQSQEMIEYRVEEGCSITEMECAALAACARFRGVDFGMFFVTKSSLINMNNYLENSWANDSYKLLMTLAFDSLLNII